MSLAANTETYSSNIVNADTILKTFLVITLFD
jgi:hypothetical protein